jgi:hypothetical protein
MRLLFTMNRLPVLLMMTLTGFTSLACRSEESKVVDKLRSTKFFYTDGTSTVTLGGPADIRRWATEWQQRGVDLFKLYLEKKGEESIRLSLAYFLVMTESRDYLDWGNNHREELTAHHEFMVWAHVLRHEEAKLVSASYREAMTNVLADLALPYARLAVAVEKMRRGETEAAVPLLLDLMSDPVWDFKAVEMFKQLDRADLERYVTPYLESESIRSVGAAELPVNVPSMAHMRPRAIQHLRRLARSHNKEIAEAAAQVLEVEYGLTTQPG